MTRENVTITKAGELKEKFDELTVLNPMYTNFSAYGRHAILSQLAIDIANEKNKANG